MSKLQTALEKALPIVAAAYGEQFGVDVVLSGRDAHTNGRTIHLPLLSGMSDMREVLFGYLAHEAAHIRDSDFGTLDRCKSPLEKHFTNVIEDIRIERLMQSVFPGTQFTLDAMWTHIVDENMSPPACQSDNEATQLHQYLLHRLRSEVLGREASIPPAEASRLVVEQTFPAGFFVRLDGLFGKYLDNLSCSDDCLRLARAILKALKDAEEEERQNEKSDQPEETSDSSEDDQSQQDDGADDGSNEGADGDTLSPLGQGDSSKDDSADNQQGGSSDCDGEGNQMPGAESGNQLSSGQEDSSSAYESLISETDLPEDAIGQLRGQLADQACEDNDGEVISINASGVGSDARNGCDTSSLTNGILASSAIRSRLLGLLQAKNRTKQWLHTRGKRVDGKRLAKVATGDSRVFIQREEIERPGTSVHLLLDCSGSMQDIQDVANQATVSLALAVSTIPKCDIAVSMFPGIDGEVSPVLHRGLVVRSNLGRFAVSSDGGTPLAEAMLYAARELTKSKGQRKVLIVVTDGAPHNGGAVHYMHDLLAKHLDTYAIGIGSTAVSDYFENWSYINHIRELQNSLFQIAQKFLDLN